MMIPMSDKREATPGPGTDSSDLEGQMQERRRVMERLREAGTDPFANAFRVSHAVRDLPGQSDEAVKALPPEAEIAGDAPRYAIAGRLLQVNDMGKAKFLFLRGDGGQMVQL